MFARRSWMKIAGLLLLFGAAPAFAASGPSGFSYEGRLYDSSGNPSTRTVSFILSVYNPQATCLLHIEQTPSLDLSQTDGYFSVTVGQGTVLTSDPGLSMRAIFANLGTITGAAPAGGSGCTYTPVAGDGRLLRVTVSDGTSLTAMTPDIAIGSTPYATVADSLQGKAVTDLVQVNSTSAQLTQANLESVFTTAAQVAELQNLSNGASTKYVAQSSSGTVVPGVATAPSTPTTGQFWYNTSTNSLQYYNGTTVQTLGTSSYGTNITGSSALTVAAGGTNQSLTLSGSGTGSVLLSNNVGIGTTAPVSKLNVAGTPVASTNYGLISIGSGAFDGASAGYFFGTSAGTVEAINMSTGYSGNFIDYQLAGASRFKVDASGNLTLTGNILSSGSGVISQSYTGSAGTPISVTANTLTSGNMLSLSSTSTLATSGNTGANIAVSGANTNAGVTRAGVVSSVSATGTTSTNVGASFSASGATNNYGLLVPSGYVGIGSASPANLVDIYSSNNGFGNLSLTNTSNTASVRPSVIIGNFAGGYGAASYPRFVLTNGEGSQASRSAMAASDTLGAIEAYGQYDTTANNLIGGRIAFRAETAFSTSNAPTSIAFQTSTAGTLTEKMTITSAGNVGIGTTGPLATLEVVGGSGTTLMIVDGNQGAGKVLTSNGTGVASWAVPSTTITSCPTGFALIGQGRQSFCILTGDSTAQYPAAMYSCATSSGSAVGAKLCTPQQYINACNINSSGAGLGTSTAYLTDQLASTTAAYTVTFATACPLSNVNTVMPTVGTSTFSTAATFRCCIDH